MNLTQLKSICEAATPGPWKKEDSCYGEEEVWGFWHRVGPFELIGKTMDENSTFIATFNPATIAKILAVVEAAEYMRDSEWKMGFHDIYVALINLENDK